MTQVRNRMVEYDVDALYPHHNSDGSKRGLFIAILLIAAAAGFIVMYFVYPSALQKLYADLALLKRYL